MSFVKTFFLVFFSFFFSTAFTQSRVIDSLQKIIDAGKNDIETNRALNSVAVEYTRTDMEKAKNYLYRSMSMALRLNNNSALSGAYSQLVTLHISTGKKDSAQYYLKLLETISSGNATQDIKANYYYAAGLYYKKQDNFKQALPFLIKSLDNYIALDKKNPTTASKTSIAGQYLNIGNTLLEMGSYKSATEYHLKGLKLFEELNNKRGISFCLQSMSSDLIYLNRYKEAISYVNKSAALKNELNDKKGVIVSTAQLGTIYKGLGNYDSALIYMNNALKAFHEMKLTPDEARILMEMGKTASLKKDIALAKYYYNAARELGVQIKDSTITVAVDAEMAAMQNGIALQNRSEQKLMANLETAVRSEDKTKELSSYQYLADYYSGIKQYDKALEYTVKLHQANDSLQSRDVEVQIKKMEEQYNFEKKEKEIALLKKDKQINLVNLQKQRSFQYVAIIFLVLLLIIGLLVANRYRIVQQSKRMLEMERVRNNIARDLHDDIGSTITSINILSKMALEQQAAGENIESVHMQKIKDRSAAIMESMGDIVWAINPQNDTFEQMVFRMKEFAAEMLDPLNINYQFITSGNFSAIKLDIQKRKDFYLLFKEALHNAAKYSNCSSLTISLSQQANTLQLEITDDGIGFNELVVKQGNGLRNMRERAAAMEAAITIDAAVGKGTRIQLVLPIT
jgi:two-component system sensor histidine kinase UhpB